MKYYQKLKTANLILLSVMIILSCQKKDDVTQTKSKLNPSLTIIEAKNYIESVSKKIEINTTSSLKMNNTSAQNKVKIKDFASLLKWENSLLNKIDSTSFIITPLDEEIKPLPDKKHEFVRNVIFYKIDSEPGIRLKFIEVLCKKDQTLGNEIQRLVKACLENDLFNKEHSFGNLNAYVIIYDGNYTETKSYKIENGKWEPFRIKFNSKLPINNF